LAVAGTLAFGSGVPEGDGCDLKIKITQRRKDTKKKV